MRRRFTAADQVAFAALTGDHNPMHLDPLLARRTQAGAPVVHGIHMLLWALDRLAAGGLPPLRRLKARFVKFLYVDDPVEVEVTQRTAATLRVRLVAGGLVVTQIALEFGLPGPAAPEPDGPLLPFDTPQDLAFDQVGDQCGQLATAPAGVAAFVPAAAAWLGPDRAAALAATTTLVGMICPGLHSIYGAVAVECVEGQGARLGFRVAETDARFRLVQLGIAGGGLHGTIDSFVRSPPVAAGSTTALAASVTPGEFAGAVALVVGGSRGLGEIAAKLLAAGGADVWLTYRVGRADGEAVALDIRAAGLRAETLPYDASAPAIPQLADLAPTHAYWFPTPAIFRPQAALFARARLDAFLAAYVDGFADLAQALRVRRADVSLFYPSSVAVAERPPGMTEYAMAKAAGEALAADMNAAWAPLRVTVHRLPRLATDQTATVTPVRAEAAVPILLAALRDTQSWPRRQPKPPSTRHRSAAPPRS